MMNRVNPPACLPVLSLSLSLLRIRDIISKPVIIDSPKCSLIRLLETVNLRLICPKEITKIPC